MKGRNPIRTLARTVLWATVFLMAMISWTTAQEPTDVLEIKPVPGEGIAERRPGGLDIQRPHHFGPLDALLDNAIVIGDRMFRVASDVRFVDHPDGLPRARSLFTVGSFVACYLNEDREVTLVWPVEEEQFQ